MMLLPSFSVIRDTSVLSWPVDNPSQIQILTFVRVPLFSDPRQEIDMPQQ